MAHKWTDHPYDNQADNLMKNRRRRCSTCGAVQERVTDYAWMRVTGYRWTPLAGRCLLPAKKEVDL
jgi:hypothetical protein